MSCCIKFRHLEEINESSFLFSLYEQIIYCTASLGRVGFDFSFLMAKDNGVDVD